MLCVLRKLGQTLACHYQHIIPIHHTNSSSSQQNSMKLSKLQLHLWQEAVQFLITLLLSFSILKHLRRLNANVAHVQCTFYDFRSFVTDRHPRGTKVEILFRPAFVNFQKDVSFWSLTPFSHLPSLSNHHVDEDEYGTLLQWQWQRKPEVFGGKSAPLPLCPPLCSHWLTWGVKPSLRSEWPAWAIARPEN